MKNKTFLTDADFNKIVDALYVTYKTDGYQAVDFDITDADNKQNIDDVYDCLNDWLSNVWCDDFGWKYGEQTGVSMMTTAKEICKAIADKLTNG